MFFVMIKHPGDDVPAIAIRQECGEIAFFETEDAAIEAAENCRLARYYGYEIFELGTGYQY